MLSYELCKQLKDAGFPQGDWNNPGEKYWSIYDGGATKKKPEIIDGSEANYGFMEDLWRIPTLSELIEACGEEFYGVFRETNKKDWVAITYTEIVSELSIERKTCKTSEEAVAKLWLKLND